MKCTEETLKCLHALSSTSLHFSIMLSSRRLFFLCSFPSSVAAHNETSRDLIEIYCIPGSEFESSARLVSLFQAENGLRCENVNECQNKGGRMWYDSEGDSDVKCRHRRKTLMNRRNRILTAIICVLLLLAQEMREAFLFQFHRNSIRLLGSFFFMSAKYSPEWM